MTTKSSRLGLVLSGGGAKGAYQVGIIKYLADMNISIDAIAGTSIGALNGAVIAAEPNLKIASTYLQEIWYSIACNSPININRLETIAYIGLTLSSGLVPLLTGTMNPLSACNLQTLFSENLGLMEESPIHELLDRYLNLQKLRHGLPLYVSVYRSDGGLNDLFLAILADNNLMNTQSSDFLHIQSLEEIQQRNAILASAALPLLIKAKQINIEETEYLFSDGGMGGRKNFQGNTPITPLVSLEKCTHVIVNHLSDGSLWNRHDFPSTTVLEIRPGRAIKRQDKVKDLIDFNAKNIQSWIEQGYEDAQRCCEGIAASLYGFHIATQAKKQRDEEISKLEQDNFHID
ncbi:patatin-like phospholipase family protein [Scytonema sp. UIC 10036]|uniref:patatin-like phospholipase family protein n=1 Tax=Scytonema sp. UIC 10036 TaxID=2304196 RepID=UPI00140FA1C6|nr:patatin-like phospholipase family protein [Scytonema sp. UIC 10036]